MQISYYPENVMNYLLNPVNTGALDIDDSSVYSAEIGSLDKGLIIKLYLKIEDGIIRKVNYLVYADGYMIASLGRLSEDLANKKVKQALNYSTNNLVNELEIPQGKQAKLKLVKQCLELVINKYLETK